LKRAYAHAPNKLNYTHTSQRERFTMKKLFQLLSLLLLGTMLLPSCSEDETGKPLVVACEASTSPYCYFLGNDTEPPVAGVDIDLIEAIGKELGRPVQYKIVPFQQIFTMVSMGKADIGAAGVTITADRAERVLFSTVYDLSSQVIVVPSGSSIADETMLKNARVAAQEGTSDLTLLRERIKPRAVIPFLTQENVNAALVDRKADAAVMDAMQAEIFLKSSDGAFKILEKPLTRDQYGLVFNKKNQKLAEAANKVIDRMKDAGEIQKSRAHHIQVLCEHPGQGAKEPTEVTVKPLVLCLEASFAPFAFISNNDIVGVDIDLAQAIANELKRPLHIHIVPFSEVIPLVAGGDADMGASGISITPERSAKVLFTIPYEDGVRRILTAANSEIDTLEKLEGKVVGAKKATTHEQYAMEKLHAKETKHYDSATQGILALLNHEIDAFVDDEAQADLAAGKYVGQIEMLNIAIPAEQYGFAIRPGDTALKEAADKVIHAKRETGEVQALFLKYNTLYKQIQTSGI